jgi:flagellar basal body-associated protein FliL
MMNLLELLPSKSLIIQYALLAITLFIGGALITTVLRSKHQESKIEALSTTVVQQSMAVSQRDEAIESLERARTSDAQALRLMEQVRLNLLKASRERVVQLRDLEQSDADVRKYLSTPIPDSLSRLLNDNPTSAGNPEKDQPKR